MVQILPKPRGFPPGCTGCWDVLGEFSVAGSITRDVNDVCLVEVSDGLRICEIMEILGCTGRAWEGTRLGFWLCVFQADLTRQE